MDMFSYDVAISPSPAEVDLTVAVSGAKVQATVASVPSLSFLLTPTGNLIQKILSAIAWPIAELISLAIKNKPKDMLEGKVEDVATIGSYTTEGIVITPSDVAIASASIGGTSMVKITASLSITAAP